MTTLGRHAISAEEWVGVRELFFSAREKSDEEREVLLNDESVSESVRTHARRLLSRERQVGDRFEIPAAEAMLEGGEQLASRGSLAGRRVGPYQIIREIGIGGMGAVYLATRVEGGFEQQVAIKTVWRGAASDVLLRRFESERAILAGLKHRNVATLIDGGATEDGLPYLVMEYVDGLPIDKWCDENRLLIDARLTLFRQVCAAVQHAHATLVVHRDLKPSNVLVTKDGSVKLLDFGIAKITGDSAMDGTLTRAGLSPFTTAYAAPEQVSGGTISIATDIYALGALLYLLLCGRTPLDTETLSPAEAITAIRDREIEPPSSVVSDSSAELRGAASRERLARVVRGELDAIALTALRKEPRRRYATVDALSQDIARYLRNERVLARPDTLGYRMSTFARRQRALVIGVSIALLALVTGGAVASWKAIESRREAARSEQVTQFLTRMFIGADEVSGDPIVRLGSRGTVAQLLDSAVRRVPHEFPDDPRTRARLYTAVGSHFASQGRLREAEESLDSAVRLARIAYGPRSDAFATASLELADAIIGRRGPDVAATHVDDAQAAMSGRMKDAPDLYERAVLMRARVARFRGSVRTADSLARAAYSLAAARDRKPAAIRASILNMLAATAAWIRRDPRVVDSLYAHSIAISDSLHTPLAHERIEALNGRINTLAVLDRKAAVDSAVSIAIESARTGYGESSIEFAGILARQANVASTYARTRADSAAALATAKRAWDTLDRVTDAGAESIADIAEVYLMQLADRKDFATARAVAERMLERVLPQRVPIAIVVAHLDLGNIELMRGDAVGAERSFRAGMTALAPSGDLNSILPKFRRPLAEAVRRQGRVAEADSIAALDPPPAARPRCTPGGDWRGC